MRSAEASTYIRCSQAWRESRPPTSDRCTTQSTQMSAIPQVPRCLNGCGVRLDLSWAGPKRRGGPGRPSIVVPEILDVGLCQPLVKAIGLLPPGKSAPQNADFLRRRRLRFSVALALLRAAVLCIGAVGGTSGSSLLGDRGSHRCSTEFSLSCTYVLQSSTRASLLGQGAVEYDCFSVLELAEQGWQLCVELVGRNPLGAFDVSANVICREHMMSITVP